MIFSVLARIPTAHEKLGGHRLKNLAHLRFNIGLHVLSPSETANNNTVLMWKIMRY